MKFLHLLLAALLTGFAFARPALDRPNLVVVFLDDCGYGFFSHTGHPTIHTPNVTRFVQQGANFPQFYAASPACSASRYSLLTGRNPRRSGFGTWTGTNVSNDCTSPAVKLIRTNPVGTTPIPGYEILTDNLAANIPVHEDLTRRYRDLSVDFIKANKDSPFLLYIAPNMPHLPVHAGNEFKGKSLAGLLGDGMEEVDAMVGTLVATPESEGIAQNTLFIFTSDNGQWILHENTASHSLYGEARFLVGSAQPFRDGKGSTWEGGVRVPGVWCWPGTIAPRTVIRTPASTMDILPTAFAPALLIPPRGTPDDAFLESKAAAGQLVRPLFKGGMQMPFIDITVRAKVQLAEDKTFGGILGVKTLAAPGAFVDLGSATPRKP